ncbi:STAS domain-containing protein [Hydrogenovibrio sp. 3SP14C1]|uniref:STAS domain-containing protein n=1 Tax=Hydrogenovibrio sp. 3SP14C1 TaxID=3038774 RepID=UPI00241708C4|nr:STAS domain-containing protein [Hydrogenovibrio sp. 3SP14C1]MDG4813107.1 STAS domain-containing protein [Hydrogenovibrio sp. 3SP14C1]
MSENTIELPENLTIHHIEEEFSNLKIAFQSDAETYKLVAGNVEAIDTSGLQALLALIKSAMANQKRIEWDSPTDVLKMGAEKLGLTEKIGLTS